MMRRSLNEIVSLLQSEGCELETHFEDDSSPITSLLLDSRNAITGVRNLFFALRGKNHDGHQYLKDLKERGVTNFVVEELPKNTSGANYILVKNSLQALQQLAAAIRAQSEAEVIAITGSNGKTVVKEWLFKVINNQFNTLKSPLSYNSQVGVPLSVWPLSKSHQMAVFEAGISKPGEMQLLEKILKPTLGIFTNLGSAHSANFKSRQAKALQKLLLFKSCQSLIYCEDQEEVASLITDFCHRNNVAKWSWSFKNAAATLWVNKVEQQANTTLLSAIYKSNTFQISVPFTDDASIENAVQVWLSGLYLGMDNEKLKPLFAGLEPIAMRLEMNAGFNDNLVINDAYNSDIESLKNALNFLDQQAGNREKVLVLSDILQNDLPIDKLYEQVQRILLQHQLSTVISIGAQGEKFNWAKELNVVSYAGTGAFLKNLFALDIKNSAVLLKGARSFQFEKISSRLEAKSHETVLEINLGNAVRNLNYFRAKLKPSTKIMAMVKAFSYGSGAYEIASLLEYHKVDYLAVAYTDEGVALRQAGVTVPIMVLNAEVSSFADLLNYHLEPEIYSQTQLHSFSTFLSRQGQISDYPIHVKLETGMHRLGFEREDLTKLLNFLKTDTHVKVASVFSHLAASDNPSHKAFTLGQINAFAEMKHYLEKELEQPFLTHILNSSGISSFADAQFDMVRLGIGLYGISDDVEVQKHLKVVSSLKATVSQIRKVKKGESVGYGRAFVAAKECQIAVISIGYADGFRRSLGEGIGSVIIKGLRYPVVGKVCMDMCMINVTDGNVEEGDVVEIFGAHLSIYELAKTMQTIPYEVLTGVSQRVKRVYLTS